MSPSTPRRARLSRVIGVCGAIVLLGLVAGCAGGSPGSDGSDGSSEKPEPAQQTSNADPAAAFCSEVEGVEADLALVKMEDVPDPAGFPGRVAAVAERFATVEPPEEIEAAWMQLKEFFTFVNEALSGVEVTTRADLDAALKFDGEDAFALVLTAPGQAELVGAYIQDACGVDLGITPPAVTDVCALVDPAQLGSVFGGSVPAGHNMPWGEGIVECGWDDGNDHEVGVVVLPADAMRNDILEGMSPVDTANAGGVAIDVYDGAIGPLRAGAGRTAAAVSGSTGVLVAVSSGDPQAEATKAIALAGLVLEQLP